METLGVATFFSLSIFVASIVPETTWPAADNYIIHDVTRSLVIPAERHGHLYTGRTDNMVAPDNRNNKQQQQQ